MREFQVLTTAYSAEFGNAVGGVVNIVTKSGTNTRRGELFLFHRNEHLNAKDYFERFDPFGNAIDRAQGTLPALPVGWHASAAPSSTDRMFYFLALERLDVEANNFVNIDANAAAMLEAGGFPVALGNVPYDLEDHAGDWQAVPSMVGGALHHVVGPLSTVTNGNFRSYGGLTAASHGVTQNRDDWALSATESDVWGTSWVNEARGQIARHDQQTLALDPRCGGPCTSESEGGPEIIIPGIATLGRNIYEPTVRDNWRLQILRHRQPCVGFPHGQGGRLLHLSRPTGAHAARVRRLVHVRAAPGDSRSCFRFQ